MNFPSIERYSPTVSRLCWSTAYIKLLRKTRIDKLDALKGKQREALYEGKFIREFLTYWLFLFTLIKVYGVSRVSSSNRFHLFTIPAVNRHFVRRVNRTNEDTVDFFVLVFFSTSFLATFRSL